MNSSKFSDPFFKRFFERTGGLQGHVIASSNSYLAILRFRDLFEDS